MSKDIWHKPIETTDVDNNLIIDDWTNGTYELGYFDDNDMIFRNFRNDDIYDEESMMCWCDVDELIDDYGRIRKALYAAVGLLKIMNDGLPNGNRWKWEIEKALEQITALTKGGDNDKQ